MMTLLFFTNWDSATYHIPNGSGVAASAQEIEDSDPTLVVTRDTFLNNPDGADIPSILSSAPSNSDISDLYYSIINQNFSGSIGSSDQINSDDLPTTPDGKSQELIVGDSTFGNYDREQGTLITDPAEDDPAINPLEEGTVEAWVYVENHANWAGIVHKGIETDFSDEGYTLQFWGNRGNVAFGIVDQSPYRYSITRSNLRLNTGKWYYLVGTWDADSVDLRIYWDNDVSTGSGTQVRSYSISNTVGTPYENSGPLVIGSQFMESYGRNGYYGFDGKIYGVAISDYAKSATETETYFDDQKAKSTGW
jgi:hypothetical protein